MTRGFSIIELMVVVTVLAILATLAGPSLADLVERRRLASQTEALTDLLQLARSEAIKHSGVTLPREVGVTISPGATWFVGLSHGSAPCTGPEDCTLNDGGVDVARLVTNAATAKASGGDVPCAGCQLVQPEAGEVIVFSFRGMVESGGNRTIVIQSPSGRYETQIEVSRIGRVSVCTPTTGMTGYTPC